MAGRCDIAATRGKFVYAPANLRPHFCGRYAWLVENELTIDAAAECDTTGKFLLQGRQVISRLARVPDVSPHLHHVRKYGFNLATGVLVNDYVSFVQVLVHTAGMFADSPSPNIRRQKELVLGSLIIPIPDHVESDSVMKLRDQFNIEVGDGFKQSVHALCLGYIGDQRLFHSQQKI